MGERLNNFFNKVEHDARATGSKIDAASDEYHAANDAVRRRTRKIATVGAVSLATALATRDIEPTINGISTIISLGTFLILVHAWIDAAQRELRLQTDKGFDKLERFLNRFRPN